MRPHPLSCASIEAEPVSKLLVNGPLADYAIALGEPVVVDSRLAWYFFADALKAHLVTDPIVAAWRVLGRPSGPVEHDHNVAEAGRQLARRSESERQRFLSRYGADKSSLCNYDLVCDTTSAAPEQTVARIVEVLTAPIDTSSAPICYLDPSRVRQTAETEEGGEIVVRYQAPHFFAVRGHRRLRAAVRAGQNLTPAALDVASGRTS